MSTSHRFSRRAFAKATGIGLGFLPMLAADRASWGQAGASPKRLITIAWPNGVSAGHFWPDAKKGPYDYTFTSAVSPTDFSLKGLDMIEPMEPHRQNMILLLKQTLGSVGGGGHETLPLLLDVGGGNTLDWQVANKIGAGSKFKTLNLAVQKRDNRGHIFHGGQRVTMEGDPFKLFDSLFSSGGLDPKLFEKQRAARKSVLDFVGKQLESFGKTLGTTDRQRVEFHLTNVREVEKRLDTPSTSPAGRPASLPATKFDVRDTRNFHLVTRAFNDLIVLALASDLTRVVTLLMSDGDAGGLVLTWLPGPQFQPSSQSGGLGNNNSHHSISHTARQADYYQVQRWFIQQQADLISRLKETVDPTGASLFKSTLVFSINNMTTGGGHGTDNLPCFVATGLPNVKTGRYLREGAPLKGLLGSIAAASGAPLGGSVHPTFGA